MRYVRRNITGPTPAVSALQRDLTVPIPLRTGQSSFGRPFDRLALTGRATQRLLVTVRENELKRLIRPVFLDTTASHVQLHLLGLTNVTRRQRAGKRVRSPTDEPEMPAMSKPNPGSPVTIADFEVTTALPRDGGFTLNGEGRDGANYELSLDLDMPMSNETRLALGEMLAQSECRLSRVAPPPSLRTGARRIGQVRQSS